MSNIVQPMEEDKVNLMSLAKAAAAGFVPPKFIPNQFKTSITSLEAAPAGFRDNKMVIKAGLKGMKKKAPVRFFRISNRAWGVVIGDF